MEGLVQTGFRVQILQLVDAFLIDASWNAKKNPKINCSQTRGGGTFKEKASSKTIRLSQKMYPHEQHVQRRLLTGTRNA